MMEILKMTSCPLPSKFASGSALRFVRRQRLAHLSVGSVVRPAGSVHAVLDLEFGEPEVVLWTTLDYYSRYLSGLAEVHLDPARGCWGRV